MRRNILICAVLSIVFFLTGCGGTKKDSVLWDEKDIFEQTLVTCMTEYRDLYWRTHSEVANADVKRAEVEEASLAETEPYFIYRIEDIGVYVKKVSVETEPVNGTTEYQFFYGDKLLFIKQLYEIYDESWVEEPKFYYLDMTGDGEKDILAIVPWMFTGTNPLADMVLVYDVARDKEIPVFDGCLDLTKRQEAQLQKILKNNKAFSVLFPQYQYIFRAGHSAYVDEEGTLYCDFAIWRENGITDNIGEIFAAFTYNAEEDCFEFDPERIAFISDF